jgi:lipopolysaccharide export system permease protein
MAKLDRYIAGAVFSAMLLVLLVLGGLDLLFTIVDELGETEGGYGTVAAIQFVLLKTPRHLYELLPATALIGALAGLGMLAGTNELVSIQAAGWSRGRISWAVLQPTLVVMVLGLVLGEFLAPPLELQAEVNKALARGQTVGLSRFGHWQRDGNTYVHFNALEANGTLIGVSLFVFDDKQRLLQQLTAARAQYLPPAAAVDKPLLSLPSVSAVEPVDQRWLLLSGSLLEFNYQVRSQTDPSELVINTQSTFAEKPWLLDLSQETLQEVVIDPDRMSISNLWRSAKRFTQQGLDAAPYQLGFWKKALQPLNTLVLVLIAISFIFGPLRAVSMGSRVFTAISLGLVITILQKLVQSLSAVYGFSPLLAVLAPIALCLVIGVGLLKRRA